MGMGPWSLGQEGWTKKEKARAIALLEVYAKDPVRFIRECVSIQVQPEEEDGNDGKGGEGGRWVPFDLWPGQERALSAMHEHERVVLLKARQNGFSWLCLGLGLHRFVCRPGSAGLLISLRETEAKDLLRRFRGMHARLPSWMRARELVRDEGTALEASTGSKVMALPANRGDSYTAAWALIDEAALIPHLGDLLDSVEPTVADGGQLWMVSRANKRDPAGSFARIARQAIRGDGQWRGVFSAWHERPGRDAAWYERQRQRSLDKDGTLDQLHGQFPSSPDEALAPSSANRRLPAQWLDPVYEERPPLRGAQGAPALLGLRIYHLPVAGVRYVIGADPAAGLQTGDDSAAVVVEAVTGRECAVWQGKLEPHAVFPDGLAQLSRWYGGKGAAAEVLVERNSLGVGVVAALEERGVPLLQGPDGKAGYAKTETTKQALWGDVAGEVMTRSKAAGIALVHDEVSFGQLASLEARTCKAPSGQRDDVADAWGLAQWARRRPAQPTAAKVAEVLSSWRR